MLNFITAFTVSLNCAAVDFGKIYREAVGKIGSNTAVACTEFQKLAASPTPFRELSRLRVLQSCMPASEATLNELDQMYLNMSLTWMRPLLAQVLIAQAKKLSSHKILANYSVIQSKDLSSQHEKETLLQSGLASARELGLTDKAREIEAEIFRISPRLNPSPEMNLWFKVAEDYRMNEKWTEALQYYERIGNSTLDVMTKMRALNGIRELYKTKFRFYKGPVANFMSASLNLARYAEKQLKTNTLPFNDNRSLMEAWTQYARDQWSYGDLSTAKSEIERCLQSAWLSNIFKAHALWIQTRIFSNYGEWQNAGASSDKLVALMRKEVDHAEGWTDWHWQLLDESLWSAAYAYRKGKNAVAAEGALDLALLHTPNAGAQSKFLFWLGQTQKEGKRDADSRSTFERLTFVDPFGYYGHLANRELGQKLSPLAKRDLDRIEKPKSVNAQDFAILSSLRDADEFPLAQRYSRTILNPHSIAVDELLLRGFVRDFATISTVFFGDIPLGQRNDFMAVNASLLFPQPYSDIVVQATNRNSSVNAEYVYSIMRQESGFNPLARSWANAYGLLQMLPSIARSVQDKAGVHFENDYELFRPEINIPVGVAHMDDISRSVNGSFIMRTASYNAALSKVKEWKDRFYNGNVYEFVEDVPYEETRSYIRLVMRNYLMNARLNSAGPVDFPERLLQL